MFFQDCLDETHNQHIKQPHNEPLMEPVALVERALSRALYFKKTRVFADIFSEQLDMGKLLVLWNRWEGIVN